MKNRGAFLFQPSSKTNSFEFESNQLRIPSGLENSHKSRANFLQKLNTQFDGVESEGKLPSLFLNKEPKAPVASSLKNLPQNRDKFELSSLSKEEKFTYTITPKPSIRVRRDDQTAGENQTNNDQRPSNLDPLSHNIMRPKALSNTNVIKVRASAFRLPHLSQEEEKPQPPSEGTTKKLFPFSRTLQANTGSQGPTTLQADGASSQSEANLTQESIKTPEKRVLPKRIILDAEKNRIAHPPVKIEEDVKEIVAVQEQSNPDQILVQKCHSNDCLRTITPPEGGYKTSQIKPFVRKSILQSFENARVRRMQLLKKPLGLMSLNNSTVQDQSLSKHTESNPDQLKSFCFEELSTVNSALITSNEEDSYMRSHRILDEIPEDASDCDEQQETLSKNASSLSREASEIEYTGDLDKLCMLGAGSEAKIYLVRLIDYSEDLLALKQYEAMNSNKQDKNKYQMLTKEFNLLRKLEHPNIIRYHSLYKTKKDGKCRNMINFGILMEYMPGGSLAAFIEESFQNISLMDKKRFMKQILEGLCCLHENNVIHRDLKVILQNRLHC